MIMDAGMDTGPILTQRKISISDEDTTGSLEAKLAELGGQLLLETIPRWLERRVKSKPQDDSQATYTRIIKKEDGKVDWRLSNRELWRQVRAFDPWPGSYTYWKGSRLKLLKVVPLYDKKFGEPGSVVALPSTAAETVGVQTGDGILGLVRVQLEGKRELSADEFARGQRDFIGSTLL